MLNHPFFNKLSKYERQVLERAIQTATKAGRRVIGSINEVNLIDAPTGFGKTTAVLPAMAATALQTFKQRTGKNGVFIIVEPTRLLTESAANRIQELWESEIGQKIHIDYAHRDHTPQIPRNKPSIIVATTGTALNTLQGLWKNEPSSIMSDNLVGVIPDEQHLRSSDIDAIVMTILSMNNYVQELKNHRSPDLWVSTATLDRKFWNKMLAAVAKKNVIEAQGEEDGRRDDIRLNLLDFAKQSISDVANSDKFIKQQAFASVYMHMEGQDELNGINADKDTGGWVLRKIEKILRGDYEVKPSGGEDILVVVPGGWEMDAVMNAIKDAVNRNELKKDGAFLEIRSDNRDNENDDDGEENHNQLAEMRETNQDTEDETTFADSHGKRHKHKRGNGSENSSTNRSDRGNGIKRATNLKRVELLPVHGMLAYENAQAIYSPPPADTLRVIVATRGMLGSGVTPPFTRYVIDTGLSRALAIDPNTGAESLVTVKASRADHVQASGRTGRLKGKDGVSIHAVTKQDWYRLNEFPKPELTEYAQSPLLLASLLLRIHTLLPHIENVVFPPDVDVTSEQIDKAISLLQSIGAIDKQRKITNIGRALVSFPLEPTLSLAMLRGLSIGQVFADDVNQKKRKVLTYMRKGINKGRLTLGDFKRVVSTSPIYRHITDGFLIDKKGQLSPMPLIDFRRTASKIASLQAYDELKKMFSQDENTGNPTTQGRHNQTSVVETSNPLTSVITEVLSLYGAIRATNRNPFYHVPSRKLADMVSERLKRKKLGNEFTYQAYYVRNILSGIHYEMNDNVAPMMWAYMMLHEIDTYGAITRKPVFRKRAQCLSELLNDVLYIAGINTRELKHAQDIARRIYSTIQSFQQDSGEEYANKKRRFSRKREDRFRHIWDFAITMDNSAKDIAINAPEDNNDEENSATKDWSMSAEEVELRVLNDEQIKSAYTFAQQSYEMMRALLTANKKYHKRCSDKRDKRHNGNSTNKHDYTTDLDDIIAEDEWAEFVKNALAGVLPLAHVAELAVMTPPAPYFSDGAYLIIKNRYGNYEYFETFSSFDASLAGTARQVRSVNTNRGQVFVLEQATLIPKKSALTSVLQNQAVTFFAYDDAATDFSNKSRMMALTFPVTAWGTQYPGTLIPIIDVATYIEDAKQRKRIEKQRAKAQKKFLLQGVEDVNRDVMDIVTAIHTMLYAAANNGFMKDSRSWDEVSYVWSNNRLLAKGKCYDLIKLSKGLKLGNAGALLPENYFNVVKINTESQRMILETLFALKMITETPDLLRNKNFNTIADVIRFLLNRAGENSVFAEIVRDAEMPCDITTGELSLKTYFPDMTADIKTGVKLAMKNTIEGFRKQQPECIDIIDSTIEDMVNKLASVIESSPVYVYPQGFNKVALGIGVDISKIQDYLVKVLPDCMTVRDGIIAEIQKQAEKWALNGLDTLEDEHSMEFEIIFPWLETSVSKRETTISLFVWDGVRQKFDEMRNFIFTLNNDKNQKQCTLAHYINRDHKIFDSQ